MREQVETQRQHLVTTLQRMQRRLKGGGDRESAAIYAEEYAKEIQKYENMLRGGDGGPFRDSEFTIRELHFANWRDSDFQLLLEAVGEVPVIDDEEWELRFGGERSFFGKLFGKGGRPK
jgi:hypothetical protein